MSSNNLKMFQDTVLSDPLFAAEGLDVDKAKEALFYVDSSLQDIQRAWGGMKAKLFFLKYPLNKTAQPIDFLNYFLESESLRRKFLKHPTEKSARTLLAGWEKAAEAYLQGARAYGEALRISLKIDNLTKRDTIGYFHKKTTLHDILSWSELLVDNARQLVDEVEKRRRLLGEGKLFKQSGASKQQGLGEFNSTERIPIPINEKLNDLIRHSQSKVEVLEEFPLIKYYTDHFNEGKLISRLFNVSTCHLSGTEIDMLSVTLADDIYFYNLEDLDPTDRSKGAGSIIYKANLERGFTHWYQPATLWYTTLDQTYYADLATIIDLKLRPGLRREHVLLQRSSLLDLIFGTGVYMNKTAERITKISSYHCFYPQLSYFYFVRSYPSIYFLSFNTSVWRINRNSRISGDRIGKNYHYDSLMTVQEKYTLEQIKEIMDISFSRKQHFHKELMS